MKRALFLATIYLAAAAPAALFAQSRAPEIILTWRASTYAPADFRGKALPAARSRVSASFILLDNGKAADLSREQIYWYLDDNLISNKTGAQSVSYIASGAAGGSQSLRVQLPSYRGDTVSKTVDVPVVAPEAVIEAPLPEGVGRGASLRLKARPFFFNARDFSSFLFSWTVNGLAPVTGENPDELGIVLNPAGAGGNLSVKLDVRNTLTSAEGASKTIYIPLKQ